MGKTPKPLLIVALPPCDEWDELKEYEAKGHQVVRPRMDYSPNSKRVWRDGVLVTDLLDADLVLGGKCWRMTNLHVRYLDVAVKESRMLRYPKKEDRADAKKRNFAADEFDLSDDTGAEPSTE